VVSKTRSDKRRLATTNHYNPKQLSITQYFPIINKLDLIIKENESLKQSFENFSKRHFENREHTVAAGSNHKFNSNFLELLLKATQNRNFDPQLKEFGAYLFLICGRKSYWVLSENLPLPKLSTVSKFISHTNKIKEGVVRAEELRKFLDARKLSRYIWLSEDATRIVPKIEFDSTNNELVGLELPLNEDGMPIVSFFKARTAQQMKNFVDSFQTTSYLYVMMAQSMDANSPSFCLSVFGTSNKFTSEIVLKRWRKVKDDLNNNGIKLLGVSSDGDSRLLKAMRQKSELPTFNFESDAVPDEWFDWFNAKFKPEIICIQDTTHIGGKMRTRLLNSKAIRFGEC
jgi:hypothetical protein